MDEPGSGDAPDNSIIVKISTQIFIIHQFRHAVNAALAPTHAPPRVRG